LCDDEVCPRDNREEGIRLGCGGPWVHDCVNLYLPIIPSVLKLLMLSGLDC